LGPLFESIEDAAVVLIGEATHGTEEFYRSRAELTKALIVGKGFNVVVVEADWPDACETQRAAAAGAVVA
jgi:erythromycin esterase-like protein